MQLPASTLVEVGYPGCGTGSGWCWLIMLVEVTEMVDGGDEL